MYMYRLWLSYGSKSLRIQGNYRKAYIIIIIIIIMSQDSAVGIATGYGLDDQGVGV
jgi:hypothetical protein